MNTALTHFKESPLPTPRLRRLLLENYDVVLADEADPRNMKYLHNAINWAIDWHNTKEGYDFWKKIHEITKKYEKEWF